MWHGTMHFRIPALSCDSYRFLHHFACIACVLQKDILKNYTSTLVSMLASQRRLSLRTTSSRYNAYFYASIADPRGTVDSSLESLGRRLRAADVMCGSTPSPAGLCPSASQGSPEGLSTCEHVAHSVFSRRMQGSGCS